MCGEFNLVLNCRAVLNDCIKARTKLWQTKLNTIDIDVDTQPPDSPDGSTIYLSPVEEE